MQYVLPMFASALLPARLDATRLDLPYLGSVQAGFPSPAEDYIEQSLDLQSLLAPHKNTTFFFRASGRSMEPLIHDRDLLIVDRSITPMDGLIVIASVMGEFTVKALVKKSGFVCLRPLNPDFHPIVMQPGMEMNVFGVVTHAIHGFLKA